MKLIDLLNRIANGEEVPNQVKIIKTGVIFQYHENSINYYDIDSYNNALFDDDIGLYINDEVEIIEEDKPIEELKTEIVDTERKLKGISGTKYSIRVVDNILINKINELVKEVNKLKENK